MSVLECDRYMCQNIMCDRYSDDFGYICEECFNELVKSGMGTCISSFMKTPKTELSAVDVAHEEYSAEFPDRRNWQPPDIGFWRNH